MDQVDKEIKFIKVGLFEIERVRTLAHEIWPQCFCGIISDDQISYMLEMMYSFNTIQRELSKNFFYYIVQIDGDDSGYFSFSALNEGELKLHKIYLKQFYYGTGVAKKMIEFVISYAEEHGFANVQLAVNKNNLRAQTFYEKVGFAKNESYVGDIGSGYVMDDFIYKYHFSR